MSESYAPGADSPGARAGARAAGQQATSAREYRIAEGTARIQGGRTVESIHVRPNRSTESIDRTTLKWTAQNELEQAETRAEQQRQQEELEQEHEALTATLAAEATDWLEQGQAAGWIDAEGDITAEADPNWIAAGQELADYADETGYDQ